MQVAVVDAFLSALLVSFCTAELLPLALPDLNLGARSDHINVKKRFRPIYHVTSSSGWINDASGFVKFHQQYHLFYLYHPYTGAWGHIAWGHVVSDSLVDWIHYPPALMPKENYEKHGCLGGSAIVHNEYLTLFYTGNVIVNNRTQQNQNVAISSDGILFQKYLYNPIVNKTEFQNVSDFRTPKVWRFRNSWYMLVGAMSPNNQGQLLLYTSPDMFHWKLNGTVARSYGDMGYMWENPDFFEMDSFHVLIFCARGIQTDGYRFRNLYQTGYLIGKFDYSTGQFNQDDFEISTATYNTLDFGHDFYAPQTMLDSDGRRLLVGWLGMWESNFVESKEGWASLLTIVRELRLDQYGKLLMLPVRETIDLRSEMLEDAWYSPGETFYAGSKAFELIVNSSAGTNHAMIAMEWEAEGRFNIEYLAQYGHVSIDRGGEDGMRKADWAPRGDLVHWRIFFDYSAVEVYCGNGEVVFSSRIYPKKGVNVKVIGDTPLHIVQYRLRRGVGKKQSLLSPADNLLKPGNSLERRKKRQHKHKAV